jgi:hypothetical protein
VRKPKPNFASDVRVILKNEGKTALNAEELRKYLRKFWLQGYDQGYEEGHVEGIEVGSDHW